MLFRKLIIILIIFGPGLSFAQSDTECRISKSNDVDLSGKFNGHRDQGPIGWCFAHAEADALSYELRRKGLIGKNDSISAEGIALDHHSVERLERIGTLKVNQPLITDLSGKVNNLNRKIENIYIELGKLQSGTDRNIDKLRELHQAKSLAEAEINQLNRIIDQLRSSETSENLGGNSFRFLKQKGLKNLCLESDLASYQDYILQKKSEASQIQSPYGGGIQPTGRGAYGGSFGEGGVVNPYSTNGEVDYAAIFDSLLSPDRSSQPKPILCEQSNELTKVFTKLNLEEIYSVLYDSTIIDPLQELHKNNCKRSFDNKTTLDKSEYGSSDSALEVINRALSSNRPAVIDYDASILTSSDYYLNPNLNHDNNRAIGRHASTIVGRTYNCETKGYEYILKNSWGDEACERGAVSMQQRLSGGDNSIREEQYNCRDKCRDEKLGFEVEVCQDICEIDKNIGTEKKYSDQIYSCKDGYYSIPEKTLKRSVYNAMSISIN